MNMQERWGPLLAPLAGCVSVIIPVYNGACYLGAALASVMAQQAQPLEVIVVDDGSTDETPAVVAQWQQSATLPIHYRYQANAGPAAARNHGVALAQGDLLAFLDADDWWHPQKLQWQIERLLREPTLGYVVCHMQVVQAANTQWPRSLNQAHYQNDPPCLLPSALLVRREIFEQVGPFDEHYRYSDDADWFLRAKDAGIPQAVVPAPLVYKRIHASNLSHNPTMMQETLRAFHLSVRRQQDKAKALIRAGAGR